MRTYQLEGISPAAVEAFHESRAKSSPLRQRADSLLSEGVFVNDDEVIENVVQEVCTGELVDETYAKEEPKAQIQTLLGVTPSARQHVSQEGEMEGKGKEVEHLRDEVSTMKGRISDVFGM